MLIVHKHKVQTTTSTSKVQSPNDYKHLEDKILKSKDDQIHLLKANN